jgi:hypothetical protein
MTLDCAEFDRFGNATKTDLDDLKSGWLLHLRVLSDSATWEYTAPLMGFMRTWNAPNNSCR